MAAVVAKRPTMTALRILRFKVTLLGVFDGTARL